MKLFAAPSPRYWECGALLFLFLVLRFGGLALFHPAYHNQCPLEEYYRGAMGREILQGLSMPYWQYRADDFGGGSLVMGVLAAGFFKLFGSSAFVLRSIPILISLGALLLWFRILYREFSGKCAWYFSLFFILAPSVFQYYSMIPLGDHYETIFLSALAVWLFLKLVSNSEIASSAAPRRNDLSLRAKRSNLVFALFFGVLCGFGIWFAYIFAITVFALFFLWLYKNPRLLLTRAFWIFAAGFFAGFSPWIVTNIQNGFQGLSVQGVPLWYHFQHVDRANFWKISFLHDLCLAFSHADIGFKSLKGLVSSLYAAFLILPIMTLLLLHWRGKADRIKGVSHPVSSVSIYFSVYALLHLSAVQLSNFEGARHMMPLMPVIFLGWARVMESLESISPAVCKVSRIFFALPLLGLGGLLWILMVSPAYAGMLFKTKGYVYDNITNTPSCYSDTEGCLSLHRKVAEKISVEDRRGLWASLALKMANPSEDQDPVVMEKRMGISDPAFAAAFYFHFGHVLFYNHDRDLKKAIFALHPFVDEQSPVFRLCYLGMLYAFGNENRAMERLPMMQGFPGEILRELGQQSARSWWRSSMGIKEIYKKTSEVFPGSGTAKERADFLKGMGSFFIQNTYDEPVVGLDVLTKVKRLFSPEDQRSFFQGAGRSYEISYRFFPAPTESWSYENLPDQKNPVILGWIEEGRQEIRSLAEAR